MPETRVKLYPALGPPRWPRIIGAPVLLGQRPFGPSAAWPLSVLPYARRTQLRPPLQNQRRLLLSTKRSPAAPLAG
jgi:hypothetical protein